MRQFTADEIQAQFEKLPAEVRAAVTSTEINDKIEAIAEKRGLLIDQMGELVDEIGLVMLGLAKSNDFVGHVSARCLIDRKKAQDIAQDVNTEIFSTIRQHMRQMEGSVISDSDQSRRDSNISALERAGGFEIIKDGMNGESSGAGEKEHIEYPLEDLLTTSAQTAEEKKTGDAPPSPVQERGPVNDPYREPFQ
jgi:hypothetical protein